MAAKRKKPKPRPRKPKHPEPESPEQLTVRAAGQIAPDGSLPAPPPPQAQCTSWLTEPDVDSPWQHKFLWEVAGGASSRKAAKRAGVNRNTPWHEKLKNPDFAKAWETVGKIRHEDLRDDWWQRARHGWTERTLQRVSERRAVRDEDGAVVYDDDGKPLMEDVAEMVVTRVQDRYDPSMGKHLLEVGDPGRYSKRVAEETALRDKGIDSQRQTVGVLVVPSQVSPDEWVRAQKQAEQGKLPAPAREKPEEKK